MLSKDPKATIGVLGLWHLGCTVAASWSALGYRVRAVDLNEGVIKGLCAGSPPLFEPGLEESIRSGLAGGALSFSTSIESLEGCPIVFLTYDTPVRDDDTSDLAIINEAMGRLGPSLIPGSIVVISAQLPVGTCRQLRSRVKDFHSSIELVYSPENLRLGEALRCYRKPGHIVIGADDPSASKAIEELFSPMEAVCLKMNLPSAEMAKHAINSFLAASITLSNQWADLCEIAGADFTDVAEAMRHDPRIGRKAYLSPGIGFSGGTLGRDLRVLEQLGQKGIQQVAPVFGDMWRYNQSRRKIVRARCEHVLGSVKNRTIALLGMTYKPGTSTLRRSLPLEIARDLARCGARVRVFDPKADWKEVTTSLTIAGSAYEAVDNADMVIKANLQNTLRFL